MIMEFDPQGGVRRNLDRGANLPEPVHLPAGSQPHLTHNPQLESSRTYYIAPPAVNPPIYALNSGEDVSPSSKDGSKPTQALDLDRDGDPEGRRISRKWTRKRRVVPIVMLVAIIAVGAVLAGVLPTYFAGNKSSSDNSPRPSPESSDLQVAPASQLAVSFNDAVHAIVAQSQEGELMIVEFYGSKSASYLIKDRFGDGEPPKPLSKTPFELLLFGSEKKLHLFYFDDAFRMAHLVRTSQDGRDVWGLGALMDGRLPYQPADTARLSTCILTSEWSESGKSVLMVMYQSDNAADSMVLLTSSDPDEAKDWTSQPFYLGAEQEDAPLKEDSPGLLILPTTREDNGEIVPALRILWDPSDEDKKMTLGSFECAFSDESKVTDCKRTENDWACKSNPRQLRMICSPLPSQGRRVYRPRCSQTPLSYRDNCLERRQRHINLAYLPYRLKR